MRGSQWQQIAQALALLQQSTFLHCDDCRTTAAYRAVALVLLVALRELI
eukprot:SAG31_NODE_3728_length_3948_cov_1.597504_5_plen_49_part_00